MALENTLILEKRGCNFSPSEGWCKGHREDKSDVGNYRVGSYDYSIIGKDGIRYIVEFGFANGMRLTHKVTGKPLKHPKRDPIFSDYMYINTQYENENGCWRNSDLKRDIYNKHFEFSKSGILAAVNYICGEDRYTKIEFIE